VLHSANIAHRAVDRHRPRSFGKLAEEMVDGDTRQFDTWLLLALRNPADPAIRWVLPGWNR
jgi:hypothetical protein